MSKSSTLVEAGSNHCHGGGGGPGRVTSGKVLGDAYMASVKFEFLSLLYTFGTDKWY